MGIKIITSEDTEEIERLYKEYKKLRDAHLKEHPEDAEGYQELTEEIDERIG